MTSLLGVDRSPHRPPASDEAPSILHAVPRRDDADVVISLSGEIDISSVDDVSTVVTECMRTEPAPESLTIDLTEVTFCDCTGVRVLEWAHEKASSAQTPFVLTGVTTRLRRVFGLAQAEDLLTVSQPSR